MIHSHIVSVVFASRNTLQRASERQAKEGAPHLRWLTPSPRRSFGLAPAAALLGRCYTTPWLHASSCGVAFF